MYKFKTTPEISKKMSAIRSRGNASTEKRMVSIMREGRISGWRRHLDIPGRPDFAFPKEKVAVFVDGCFWHGCPRCYRAPRQNVSYWAGKVKRNRSRDNRNSKILRSIGWCVLHFWEHSLDNSDAVAERIRRAFARRAVSKNKPRS